MFTTLLVGGLILITALVILSYWCVYRAGIEKGYDEGRADKAQQQLAERKTPRHARTAPRTTPIAPALVREDPPEPGGWYVPPPGPIRSHTSAARIADVILPEPGAYKPQPARDSHPGTATLPRYGSIGTFLDAAGVRPRLGLPATTGEIAAIGEQDRADMHEEEEAWRAGMVARFREELTA